MILVPYSKRDVRCSRYEKPLYFFKEVKLNKDGFQFEEIKEIDVRDDFPLYNRTYSKERKYTAMNDLFYVTVSTNKQIVTIILRQNMKFVEDAREIQNLLYKPYLVPGCEFKDDSKQRLYGFCKIIENQSIKIRFDGDVQKVLLNGDQIIFMLKKRVVIYTLFNSSMIKAKPVDIAVNNYLYILTEKEVLIYNEALVAKMEIEKKCRFIIPTANPEIFFLVRKSIVYKVTKGVSELYFNAHGDVISCNIDEKHLYLSTLSSLYKVNMYDKEVKSIQVFISAPKIYLCDTYIVLFNSNSGLLFIKKDDFSQFCPKNLYINICGITTYKNTVGYRCSNEILLFEFKEQNNELVPIKTVPEFGAKKVDITSAEQFDDQIEDYYFNYPYKGYGVTAMYKKPNKFRKLLNFKVKDECLKIVKKYQDEKDTTGLQDAFKNIVSEIADDPVQILDSKNAHLYFKSEIETAKKYFDQKAQDTATFNNTEQALNDLLPSPKMTQSDSLSQKNDDLDNCSNMKEGSLENIKQVDNEDFSIIHKELKRIKRFVSKIVKPNPRLFEESDESDEIPELFFEDPRNIHLRETKHPVLTSLLTFKDINSTKKSKNKIHISKVFEKVESAYGIRHPLTFSAPLETVERKTVNSIELSKNYISYQKTFFFVENHFDFFKRRFVPKDINEPEKECKGIINGFIEEEFKRVIGYKQNVQKEQPKVEPILKKKKGGF